MPGADGFEDARGVCLVQRYRFRDSDPAGGHHLALIGLIAQFLVAMLDHVFQVVGEVDSIGRHLHRLAVPVTAGVDAKRTEVDRPPVRDAADGLADLARCDVLERLVIDHALPAAGVDVDHCDVVSGQQRPAGPVNAGFEVVRLTLAHSESAINRRAERE